MTTKPTTTQQSRDEEWPGYDGRPIDPTGPLAIGTIPDADLDRLVAATIPAGNPGITLPAGFLTGDSPDAELRTYAGTPHVVAGRPAGAYAVVIIDRDGRIGDDFVTVELGEAQRDLSLGQARQFAAAITRAADDLLAADPAHMLDTVGTAALLDEITRRVSGPGALRAALAAADPGELTQDDRAALLELAARAFDAAGVE